MSKNTIAATVIGAVGAIAGVFQEAQANSLVPPVIEKLLDSGKAIKLDAFDVGYGICVIGDKNEELFLTDSNAKKQFCKAFADAKQSYQNDADLREYMKQAKTAYKQYFPQGVWMEKSKVEVGGKTYSSITVRAPGIK
ncbi:MAG: hypothetical protein DI626_06090 [Micavibrio aeruginosavorus]|uniref:Uncharacterized protein n=1 Tax=Micavibrio aeruginosavorus TaxID=349221 RepID=A0A2W5A2D4_9BACT|nr:MAG: hypothetical protein DI626_06090 [Micavibrio aeruginosavorus]